MSEGENSETPGGGVDQTATCAGCGAVYDRRYLTETCRYEAGQGYRCPACDHFLEEEGA